MTRTVKRKPSNLLKARTSSSNTSNTSNGKASPCLENLPADEVKTPADAHFAHRPEKLQGVRRHPQIPGQHQSPHGHYPRFIPSCSRPCRTRANH